MQTTDSLQADNIYTVSRLNNEVRFLLEDTFPFVWVEGELSNFSAPHSGHWYFCLKDSAAQVRCAMFKGHQRKIGFTPKDGLHVLIKARVSLYENRGEFQLIAESMEERGEGKLQRAFLILKKKLEAAGLFDAAHKKPLPLFPKQIGVVTSATGAAIRDILTVLKRRLPSIPVIIYPTLVQGDAAAANVVAAIQAANERRECDVLIVSRGGGSLEDLWPFNEEIVAHAIHQSVIPIISGVGHEVDFTIADFVADKRAPTPSAAAELVTPNAADLLQTVKRCEQQITRQMQHKLSSAKQQLTWTEKHLYQQHPKRRLLEKMQRLDFCELSLVQLETRLINKLQTHVKQLEAKLNQQAPLRLIHAKQHQLNIHYQHLLNLMDTKLHKQKAALANIAGKLDALSPLATLKRGYAIASHHQTIIHDAAQLAVKDIINVRFSHGSATCLVEEINEE